MSRRLPIALTRPEQGWSSLFLLLGMLVLLGVSVADSRPLELQGHGSLSSSLPMLVLAAGLIGYLLARSSLGVVRAHLLGALLAALMLLFIAGAALLELSPLPTDLAGISERVSAVWMRMDEDIGRLISEEITTSAVTLYLVLGALCWTTAQFGAFSVFRYDRGGPAVMAVGTILFLNVGLGSLQEQEELLPVLPVLALFAALALLLLMRLQLVQQRFVWARRHISDTGDVNRLFLRTGVAFVLIAVVSASSLTAWATVEVQEIDFGGIEDPLEDLIEQVSDVLEFVGVPTGEQVPPRLGDETKLADTWERRQGIAFTASGPADLYDNYWWGKAENEYEYASGRWKATTSGASEVRAGDAGVWPAEEARAGGGNPVGVTITVGDSAARVDLFRLPDVHTLSEDVIARRTPGGGISDLHFAEPLEEGETVTIDAYVRDYRPGNESITGNRLRVTAGLEYPSWVLEHYLGGGDDPNIVGDHVLATIEEVQASGPTPYDWAVALQARLRAMEYTTDIEGLCDPRDAVPECLLAEEQGFCQQYATTMVMVMRAMGVPARFVTGYLRGNVDDGQWVVMQEALHNWAEVYFPDYGWVRFDPTPGLEDLGQVPTALSDGDVIDEPSPPPGPLESEEPVDPTSPDPTFEDLVPIDGDESGGDGGDVGVFIGLGALAGLLVALVSGVLLFRLRRLPDGDDSLAYRGIVSLATRLGYGPHPSQTEYEYASSLSESIPSVREDLYVVTDAQVQTTYGEQDLDDERRGPLRSAYARIRTALLRLSIRWRR